MSAFFFWTAWAASTNRPNDISTYTNNWPYEPLVGNQPTGDTVVWTGVSIIMLLAGISAMAWWYASKRSEEAEPMPPESDPLALWEATPSQRATIKYFWVVSALILVQMLLGVVTAHYGVEGDGFYGFPLSKWLPYSVTRTWHVQMGLFWIATAWLAAGLFIGPLVSDQDPKGQRLGVNVLFGALLVVVVGSLAGEWLSIQNKMTDTVSFYFGHQGYEYVDLGRVWQIALLVGLLLWLVLMIRVLLPALRKTGETKQLVALLAVATGAIALFYGAGLTWGQHTHLSMVEYWRWWVVHLWVEGFFEVFATTVIAFVFMRLNLIRPGIAAAAALLSATIFLSGGIIGTCHHLYFSGTPTVALAWGSVFSALEVVPLVLVGFDATEDLRRSRTSPWVQRYKWPIYFFVAVAFWNMVGAGLFGFMINPPIALYYMQGLNTTPLHGHAALFGVYGMLGIGLMLLCLRVLIPGRRMEGRTAAVLVLDVERRLDGDVRPEPVAGRLVADQGVGGTRLLVCPQQRVPEDRSDADIAMDASPGRHGVLPRSRGPGGVRGRAEDRALVPEGRGTRLTIGSLKASRPTRHHQPESGGKPMAIPHAQPGEVIDVRPLANTLASSKTRTLIKTPHVEVIRMVLPAGKVLAEHKAPGEITVQCLEGRITFITMGQKKELRSGDLLYLPPEEVHSVEAIHDSSFLLTMVLPERAK